MTAQAKPPKGAAKAAPVKSTPVPREINEIEKLFKRYKWLEADRDFQAATASTEKEFNRLFGIPDSELNAIAKRLAELRPQTFQEARWLLELVLLSFTEEGVRGDGLDEQVFRNALESLSEIARMAKY